MFCFTGAENSDDEGIRGGYNSGTDDERSNDAFSNLRARSRSPVHTTTSTTTIEKLNDDENSTGIDNKRSKYDMSETDTSGDEDPITDEEFQEVFVFQLKIVDCESFRLVSFRSKCPFVK